MALLPCLGGWNGETSVAVLPLEIEGTLAEKWQRTLQGGVDDGLARAGHEMIEPEAVRRALAEREGCGDAACAAAVAAELGASYLVRTSIAIEDRDFRVRLELLDATTGRAVADTGESCEVCAIPEVQQLLEEHAGILGGKIDALDRAPPVVEFVSRPAGALVYLDGELIGRAPVERPVSAGRHRVRARLRGHLSLEQPLEATPGTRDTLSFELEPTPRRQRLRPWGWGLLGASLPVAATGATLVALDEQPYRRRCTGEYVDSAGHCLLRYDTLGGGITTLSIGAAGLVAATVLLVLSRPDEDDRRRARVSVWPGPLPTVVGRF